MLPLQKETEHTLGLGKHGIMWITAQQPLGDGVTGIVA
jgi:hypothetical protein